METFRPRSFILELMGYIALVLVMLFVARLQLLPECIADDIQWVWLWSLYFLSVTTITLRTIKNKYKSGPAAFWFGLFSGLVVWMLLLVSEIEDMGLISEILPYFTLDIVLTCIATAIIALLWSVFISFVYRKLKMRMKL